MQPFRFLSLVPAAFALSGCIAAAIPVVAGGVVARSATKRQTPSQRPTPPAAVAATPPASQRSVVPVSEPVRDLPRLPSDLNALRPGQIYRGTMPGPATASPLPAPSPSAGGGWSDVGHHVAADLSPAHSVLMARGSDAANPRWLDCAGKPRALIVNAATLGSAGAIDPATKSWLEALRVMEVRPVIIVGGAAEGETLKAVLAKAGLAASVDGDTLMIAAASDRMPALRADIGSRYCVLAIVGRTAADFPNGLTPATTPASLAPLWGHGWFLLTGPAG